MENDLVKPVVVLASQLFGWAIPRRGAAAFADQLFRGERLGDEGEAFGRDGQSRQIKLLADASEILGC